MIKLLDMSGVDWDVEQGSKHKKLYVDGQMISVLSPIRTAKARTISNFRARVKRHLRQFEDPTPETKAEAAPENITTQPEVPMSTDNTQKPKRATPDYRTVEEHDHIDRLVELLGHSTAAEAIGMTEAALRKCLREGKVRLMHEMAARGALADLEGPATPSDTPAPAPAPELPPRKHLVISGPAEDMPVVLKVLSAFDVSVTELKL